MLREMAGDTTYDSRANFDALERLQLAPVIKVRKNSSRKLKGGSFARVKVVSEVQRVGMEAECGIWAEVDLRGLQFALKRTVGEQLSGKSEASLKHEASLKVISYLRMRSIQSS